jgi:hypothetical protein
VADNHRIDEVGVRSGYSQARFVVVAKGTVVAHGGASVSRHNGHLPREPGTPVLRSSWSDGWATWVVHVV